MPCTWCVTQGRVCQHSWTSAVWRTLIYLASIQLGTKDSVGLKTGLASFSFLCAWSRGVLELSGLQERDKKPLWLGDILRGISLNPSWIQVCPKEIFFSFAYFFPYVKLASLILSQMTSQLMSGEIKYPWGKRTLKMVNSTKSLSNVKLLSRELEKAIKSDWCVGGLLSGPELIHGIRSRISQIFKILITEFLGFSRHCAQVLY